MKKLSVLMGTAVVSAVLLVAGVTTTAFAQGTGPGNMRARSDGRSRVDAMRCADHVDATVLTHRGKHLWLRPKWSRWFWPWNDASGVTGVGGLDGMMQEFSFGCGGPGIMDSQGMMDGQDSGRVGATGPRLTAAEVQQGVATYLAGYYDDPDLEVVELMEFEAELLRPGGRKVHGDQRLRATDRSLHLGGPARIWPE